MASKGTWARTSLALLNFIATGAWRPSGLSQNTCVCESAKTNDFFFIKFGDLASDHTLVAMINCPSVCLSAARKLEIGWGHLTKPNSLSLSLSLTHTALCKIWKSATKMLESSRENEPRKQSPAAAWKLEIGRYNQPLKSHITWPTFSHKEIGRGQTHVRRTFALYGEEAFDLFFARLHHRRSISLFSTLEVRQSPPNFTKKNPRTEVGSFSWSGSRCVWVCFT